MGAAIALAVKLWKVNQKSAPNTSQKIPEITDEVQKTTTEVEIEETQLFNAIVPQNSNLN